MRTDLSAEAKQSFQVVAFLATILVVGIHYKSDVPDLANPHLATWNQLAQEFLFGGIARVAVPMFAFAAGVFYFRSDDGSFDSYHTKLKQGLRTIGLPYFIIGTIAFAVWLMLARVGGRSVDLDALGYINAWLLHPPAEQLWLLRDLLVLVVTAPLIRFCCNHRVLRLLLMFGLLVTWAANLQLFPIIAGWHLIHMETLLFFTFGCLARIYPKWIEGIGRVSKMTVAFTIALWCMLVATRITVKADFDMWYVTDYGAADLMLHQASILVGCLSLFMIAFRMRYPKLIQLSVASFFVYLIHEFPLRAMVRNLGDRVLDHDTSSWIITPLVLIGCFGAAFLLSHFAPSVVEVLTGGRTPSKAKRISQPPSGKSTSGNPTSVPAN